MDQSRLGRSFAEDSNETQQRRLTQQGQSAQENLEETSSDRHNPVIVVEQETEA